MSPKTTRMSNALKTNLILAILLIIGASAALWYEYKRKPVAEKEASDLTKLHAPLLKAPLVSVTIQNKGMGILNQFQCEDQCFAEGVLGRWNLTDPLKARADEGTFSGALSALFSTVPTEKIEITGVDDATLKEFGLEPERRKDVSVEVKTKGETTPYVFYFGERSSVGDLVYTLITGPNLKVNSVYLLSPHTIELVQKKSNYWRYKKLLDVASAEIAALEYKSNATDGSFKVVRSTDPQASSQWFIEPGHIPADPNVVDTELTSLSALQANDFVSDNKTTDAKMLDLPAKPPVQVRLVFQPTKGAKDQKPPLDILGWEDKRKPTSQYLTLSTTSFIAKIDTTTLMKLQKKSADFRLRQLFRIAEKSHFRKARIQFVKEGHTYEFLSDNGQAWKESTDPNLRFKDFESASFDQHISSLGGVSIRSFLGKKLPGPAEKTMVYDFYDGDGKSVRSFALFRMKVTPPASKPGMPPAPNARWFALLAPTPGSSPGLSGTAGEYLEIDPAYSSALDIKTDRWMKKSISTSPAAKPAAPMPGAQNGEPQSLPIMPQSK